ncbi:MAG TPA: OmpA family protein [Bacteroidales bacterium]|nr:OmpA family protein [Bacteroidales bacterium]
MRRYLHSIIIVMLLSSVALEAQTDVSVRKKDFKVDKPGFENAWKHVKDGDSYYTERGIWYGNAFDEYLQALVYYNSNPELNYKTGVSALFSDNREEAADFLLKAHILKNDVAEDVLLLIGRAMQYSGRFSEAIENYNAYLNSTVKKSKENSSLTKKYIQECNFAMIVTNDTLRIGISNLGANINSNTDDYSELFSVDGRTMYFASRRKQLNSSSSYSDSKFDENILISRQNNGSWGLPVTAGKNLTTKYCETPLFINSTNDILYIYTGYDNGGDIKMSETKKGEWKSPQSIPFRINSGGSETSFSFSSSGNEIYFVTDKGKNNLGGKDIYYIKKLNERKWSKPENAGPIINSPYDEESVRFSRSGDTLWFSSKGHNSIGGFDIFYSVRNNVGAWDSVKNYGYPVNTPWDEIFYHPSVVDDSTFFFVSNRSGGLGGLDIYQGSILPPEPVVPAPVKPDTVIIRDTIVVVKEIVPVIEPEPVKELAFYLIGKINDSETGEPVMAKIDIIDISTDSIVATTASSDENGSYRVRLPEKKSYMVDLRATGFFPDRQSISIQDTYVQDFYSLDISLVKVKVGKKVVLNNILFETGKSILTSGSYVELNRLFNILLDNPQMKIEISGHTDKTGSETINFKLSENRAKAVVDYLVQMGIERSRIEFRGYGSLQPIADNATSQGRAENRRVEFKILEF